MQYSAYPYHDWNRRITAECYWPNATSRILDSENRVTEIVNNYAKMSFNFGPSLLAWMEPNAPRCLSSGSRRRPTEPKVLLRSRFRPGPGL
jgi:alpha-amylase/alpha-mannosidase (GH57 family)